jgi:predicted regulator of Ras-like GTPase activity (Roadblock/LC7/MglB family)
VRRVDLERMAPELAPPLAGFVRETAVRLALLINRDGQVLVQHGFARSLDVVHVASLAAGIHASARELADLMGEPGFDHLHQAGEGQQVFIGAFGTPVEELVLVCVFGDDASLGIVRLFFEGLRREIGGLGAWSDVRPTEEAARFEDDLEGGVRRLFGGD